MKYLVAYDVSDTGRRSKLSRLLSKYGYRIQLSVFYLPDISRGELDRLYMEAKRLVNPRQDRVFFYPVEEIEVFEGYPIEFWNIEII